MTNYGMKQEFHRHMTDEAYHIIWTLYGGKTDQKCFKLLNAHSPLHML